MPELTILTTPNQTLRTKSKAVGKLDDRVLRAVAQMKKALRASKVPGVGLSAIQLGEPLRIFIAYLPPNVEPSIFINPKIIWRSKELNTDVLDKENLLLEGCLSVPGIYALIKRPWAIKLEYQTLSQKSEVRGQGSGVRNGQRSEFEGFNATLVQHEIDHCNGTLFTDRALEQGTQIYEVGKDEELHPVRL
ncbi:MAG: peptide deformylase [Candidatus Cloacimonetes bacterium]|nr:peptide deformylase [Candidatus Cloacimonadota bacterium]